MTRDEYGEIINSKETYKELAEEVQGGGQCVFGWTDQSGTHLDILLSCHPPYLGGGLQGGQSSHTDLFVSVMRFGAFGFLINENKKYPSYVTEKLRVSGITADKLADLINGIIKILYKYEN